MTDVTPFGPQAERRVHPLDPIDADLLVVDPSGCTEALSDAFERRGNNRSFYVRILLPPPRSALIEQLAPQLLSQFREYDARREVLAQAFSGQLRLNGTPLDGYQPRTAAEIQTLRDTIALSNGLVAGSETERRRVCESLMTDETASIVTFTDSTVPAFSTAVDANEIVIWAPHLSGDAAAVFAVALHEFHAPVTLVAATPPSTEVRASYRPPSDAACILARARVVVDADAACGDAAWALSDSGATIVASRSNGAHEFIEGLVSYDPANFFSIAAAVLHALGSKPSTRISRAPRLHRKRDGAVTSGPLVSIIVPTRNRRHLLPVALSSISRQTYNDVEIVVVNDAGEPVDDIVARYANARLIDLAENVGVGAACNRAFAESRGEFVGFIADDDAMCADHIALLVAALLRSNATVAHGDVLTTFLRKRVGSDAAAEAYGCICNMNHAMDLTEMLITNRVGATSVLFRRAAIERDPLDLQVPLNRDYLMWLRLARRFDFVHVPVPTTYYTVRPQEDQMAVREKAKNADAFRFTYAEHAVPDRPAVEERRLRYLAEVEARPIGLPEAPPAEMKPVPWPPWTIG